jgi:uncharacterized protein YndB with AHSA1/START domain
MAKFTLQTTVRAPLETVFDVLTDHRGYPSITPIRSVTLEQEGDPAPNGVGAIRALRAVGPAIREQVTEYERPTRFAYKMLSGAPVRDHTGTVTLTSQGNDTYMVYEVESYPVLPGVLGVPVIGVLRVGIKQLVNGVKKRSEQLAR